MVEKRGGIILDRPLRGKHICAKKRQFVRWVNNAQQNWALAKYQQSDGGNADVA
jgi:hypothetical protein